MKKLVIIGLAGLLGLPLATEAQKRNTNTRKTATKSNAAAQAEQEKQRQADQERQQQEQQQTAAASQLQQTSLAAHPSARPVPPSDILFQKTVWRAIDLREKQNQPMFSTGRQISKLIVDAVKRNELQAYLSDSLVTPISAQTFSANLTPPSNVIGPANAVPGAPARKTKKITKKDEWTGETITVEVYEDDGTEVPGTAASAGGGGGAALEGAGELLPSQLYRLELKESVVFDKKRSRLYHDPQAITLIMPAKYTGALGFEKIIASFKYSDLVKLFRAHPEEAIWFNAQNDAQHKNLADAFDLWLFSSYITKVSNANNNTLADGSRNGLLEAQRAMEDLIEWEYSLWSY